MSSETRKVRLRKTSENEIFGPMEVSELKHLADTAYISPDDHVAFEGEDWQPAPSIEVLGMHWIVRSKDGVQYGPTTTGTIKEFLSAGEIDKKALAMNFRTKEELVVSELIGQEGIAEVEAAKTEAEKTDIAEDPGMEESLEVAKDIRIRTLETDLDNLRKSYDELSRKFRQTSEELLALKKG